MFGFLYVGTLGGVKVLIFKLQPPSAALEPLVTESQANHAYSSPLSLSAPTYHGPSSFRSGATKANRDNHGPMNYGRLRPVCTYSNEMHYHETFKLNQQRPPEIT